MGLRVLKICNLDKIQIDAYQYRWNTGLVPTSLKINTFPWEENTINDEDNNITIICTDGAVKIKNQISYEISGYGIFSGKCLHKTDIIIYGKGQSSYSAECFAILKALEQLTNIEKKDILLLTDYRSLLCKLEKWDSWNCEIEHKISEILIKLSKQKHITLQYVKAHSNIGYNCFIYELINATCTQARTAVSKLNISRVPTTHDEVVNICKKKMAEDEEATRRVLKDRYESISSKNFRNLEINREKIKIWLKKSHQKRKVQNMLLSSITDTAFRINNTRLQCTCTKPGPPLNLEHILLECPIFNKAREDTMIYLGTNKSGFKKNEILPMFFLSAPNLLEMIIKESRETFLKRIGRQ